MEARRQRAFVRALFIARMHKEKEGASTSASKVVSKGMSKRKNERKDNHPFKKGPDTLVGDKQSKQPSPRKPNHGAGKGLMTTTGPVTHGSILHLLTHKEYAVEMVESIIKETNLDPCVEQTIEDLGASGLFDLSRVRFSLTLFYSFVHSFANSCLDLKRWCV